MQHKLPAPHNFTLETDNCENVINYVRILKTKSRFFPRILVDIAKVINICDGAISMLLSAIKDIGNEGIIVKGNYPENPNIREFLEKSGFFEHINGTSNNGTSKNTIIRTGNNKTPPSEVSEEIFKSMETIWGTRGRNPLLRGCVFEMVRNSCDHAFGSKESIFWHFSVSHHEDENLVNYSFVDNGKGIMRTLSSKGLLRKIAKFIKKDSDVLDTAFKDGIESATGLSWRGKGLPTIFELYKDGIVKNLIVISNNVFVDFEQNIRKELSHSFSGTYYHWVIDKNCIKQCFN